jgi:hypothetical protein
LLKEKIRLLALTIRVQLRGYGPGNPLRGEILNLLSQIAENL